MIQGDLSLLTGGSDPDAIGMRTPIKSEAGVRVISSNGLPDGMDCFWKARTADAKGTEKWRDFPQWH
jgi:hypothetical protein